MIFFISNKNTILFLSHRAQSRCSFIIFFYLSNKNTILFLSHRAQSRCLFMITFYYFFVILSLSTSLNAEEHFLFKSISTALDVTTISPPLLSAVRSSAVETFCVIIENFDWTLFDNLICNNDQVIPSVAAERDVCSKILYSSNSLSELYLWCVAFLHSDNSCNLSKFSSIKHCFFALLHFFIFFSKAIA
jgi:hypothetical protein